MIETTCCIVGGGPAGMMLGLAAGARRRRRGRAGEARRLPARFPRRHHPSLDAGTDARARPAGEFLKLPHQRGRRARRHGSASRFYRFADFSHLPTRCKFIALMPQWDFLEFPRRAGASAIPASSCMMQAEATGLISERRRVVGVRATTPDGALEVRRRARRSAATAATRSCAQKAGLRVGGLRRADGRAVVPPEPQAGRHARRPAACSTRAASSSCSTAATTGSAPTSSRRARWSRCAGAASRRFAPRSRAPRRCSADRVGEITRLGAGQAADRHGRPAAALAPAGLLCIGDAAHAMSPVGGVGINLAVQDAVAAANVLAEPLYEKRDVDADLLAKVQERREFPTRVTQRLQLAMQNTVIAGALKRRRRLQAAAAVAADGPRFPCLRRIPARLLGLGFRPEHIRTPERAGLIVKVARASARSAGRAACGRQRGPRRGNSGASVLASATPFSRRCAPARSANAGSRSRRCRDRRRPAPS